MLQTVVVMAVLCCAVGGMADSTAVLIGRGDVLTPFDSTGKECTLATSVGRITPWSGLPFLNVS
jgi:hypothetical protein